MPGAELCQISGWMIIFVLPERANTYGTMMKTVALLLLSGILCLGTGACSQPQNRAARQKATTEADKLRLPDDPARVTQEEEPKSFTLPELPDTLRRPEDRATYLSLHYWDHFDFTDTTLMALPEVTEQAFVDFLTILPLTDQAAAAVDTLFRRAAVEREMLYHFISLGDKYLYDPNSPMRDETLYILELRALVESPCLEEVDKIRPRNLLKMALRNRPGEEATDFAFIDRAGRSRHLSGIKADYLLLYFNNPGCGDCQRVKEQLATSPAVTALLASGRLKILALSVEGRSPEWEEATFPAQWIDGYDEGKRLTDQQLYDLRAVPTLYLLDARKRVLLKDAPLEQVEARLEELANSLDS